MAVKDISRAHAELKRTGVFFSGDVRRSSRRTGVLRTGSCSGSSVSSALPAPQDVWRTPPQPPGPAGFCLSSAAAAVAIPGVAAAAAAAAPAGLVR